MEIISSNRGGVKAYNEGYIYIKKSSNKSTIRWDIKPGEGRPGDKRPEGLLIGSQDFRYRFKSNRKHKPRQMKKYL